MTTSFAFLPKVLLIVAALGLQAAIQVMGVWFDLLRYIGAAYLIWLGYRLLRSNGLSRSTASTSCTRI